MTPVYAFGLVSLACCWVYIGLRPVSDGRLATFIQSLNSYFAGGLGSA